jgi:ubiquitin-small subunit ribosomal protein S27Ae
MAKARVGLYSVKGDQLTRTHKSCPKCGPGIFLAQHQDRLSCGKCGYSESRPVGDRPPPKAEKPKAAKPAATPPKAPAAPKTPAAAPKAPAAPGKAPGTAPKPA